MPSPRANYESANGCFPQGSKFQNYIGGFSWVDASIFVQMSQYFEQSNAYNCWNQSLGTYQGVNLTMDAIGISTLWCPSDGTTGIKMNLGSSYFDGPMPQINGFNVFYTNYAAMGGIWNSWPVNGLSSIPQMQPNSLGIFYTGSATPIAGITDGTSNTFLVAETAHGMIAPSDQPWWHHWFAGDHGDTEIDAMYAPNPQRKFQEPYCRHVLHLHGRRRDLLRVGDELPSWRGEHLLCRRLGALHQRLDQLLADRPGDLGPSGSHDHQRVRWHLPLANGPGHATGRVPEARDPRRRRGYQRRRLLRSHAWI